MAFEIQSQVFLDWKRGIVQLKSRFSDILHIEVLFKFRFFLWS